MTQLKHQPRKRFGQNFLINDHIIAAIATIIAPRRDEHLVEIGPGLGALTKAILSIVDEMDVVELDRDIIPKLAQACESLGKLNIYQADALSFDFASLVKGETPLRLIGNLPYNISTPLLFHLFTMKDAILDMHFMLQKEVVDRLTAAVSSKDYNRLSVMTQYHCHTEMMLEVPPEAFHPIPKVESAVVRLQPYQTPTYVADDYQHFSDIVRLAFAHRRKTLKNNLQEIFSAEELRMLSIDPQARAQDLSVADFVRMANAKV